MDFGNFFIPYVFEVNEYILRSFTKLIMPEWPRKSSSTSGFAGTRGYWLLGRMDFRNFFIPFVFEVKESIFLLCFISQFKCNGLNNSFEIKWNITISSCWFYLLLLAITTLDTQSCIIIIIK